MFAETPAPTSTPTHAVVQPTSSMPISKPGTVISTDSPVVTTTPPLPPKSSRKKLWMSILAVVLVFVALIGAVGIYTSIVAAQLKSQASEAQVIAQNAYTNFKQQNLPGAESELKNLQAKVQDLKGTYGRLSFYRFVPIARGYYLDGEHGLKAAEAGLNAGVKSIAAITPYADVLGFSGEGTFEGGTAENRVKLMLDTLEKVTPILDEISAELQTTQNELAQIDPNRYPETLNGTPVRTRIIEGQQLITNANTLLRDYRPIIENLPSIAGSTGERRKYLIIFQNAGEKRATGGFLTAYAVINMEDGVITPEMSDDIYPLDAKFTKKIPIPEALGRYLTTEKYFNLRDMNISPDFKQSMELFFSHYSQLKGEPKTVDGIIAVDTYLLTDLMKIVGPINVPGYGTFSAENDPRCDCPQIIYELSNIITRPTPYLRQDRKGILGPLMQSILGRIYQSPRVFLGQLFQTGLSSINARHVQMYFFKPEFQQAAEAINAAGILHNNEQAPDFAAVVNSNLGGAKSYFFIDYSMKHTATVPANGELSKTLELTYRNNRPGDNCNLEAGQLCLNSTLRDWTRIYLPAGAKLVEAKGFTAEPKTYDEQGFTVIDGFFILEPNSQAKIVVSYTVPYTAPDYKIKLWKQGGSGVIPVTFDINGEESEITIDKDTIFETKF